ncbi:MAG: glycosyltransferase, partial [Halobacteriovoraceae bacterium]|nr:glycosyltransferase [Halobacteriovoraceae bacterium]
NYSASISQKKYIPTFFLRKKIASLYAKIEKISSQFFDGIVVARPDLNHLFSEKKPKQVICNYPIYKDIKPNKNHSTQENTVVIYVGNISVERGIFQLVNAFDLLKNHKLHLLGKFENEKILDECKKMQGWQNVTYLGVCNANEIFDYIKKSHIGIVNFLPHPNHMTTLATKPFEYMMCGLPIILPDFPYWRAFFKDSAVYTDPTNPKSIAESIISLSKNKDLMETMGELNIQKVRKEYNWQAESLKLFKLYDQILV